MENQAVSGTKKPLFGGRKPLFTQKELLLLTGPLLVEQLLEVTVGMAVTGSAGLAQLTHIAGGVLGMIFGFTWSRGKRGGR